MAYPTAITTFTNPVSTDYLNSPAHATQHSSVNTDVTAIETKLGIGASNCSAATDNYVLMADGAGNSAWEIVSGAWTAYTPTWTASTANPAIGNGTLSGEYIQIGKTVIFKLKLAMGSTTTYGTGLWRLSLPVASADTTYNPVIVSAWIDDYGTMTYTSVGSTLISTTTFDLWADQSVASFSSSTPFTWAASDQMHLFGMYEAA